MRGQARRPARQQEDVAIVGVHDLGERRQHAPHLGPHRLVEAGQVDREYRRAQVEILGAALAGRFVDEGNDLFRRLGAAREERLIGTRLGRQHARRWIVGLGGVQEFERDRLSDLQRELLAQVALDHVLAAAVAAHQLGHQVGRVGYARGAHRRLDRRQDVALHDAQQDVVARHIEALAELLLGEQRDRGTATLEMVVVDDEVGGAAADVDAGDAQRAVRRLAARLAGHLEEAARVAAEIARHLGVEIDELRAARLVPVGQHARRRRGRVVELPAHHHPDEVARGLGALAEDQALGQRHAGRQGEHDAAQPPWRLGMGAPAALLRRVHQGQRLQQDLAQRKGHDRGARIERLEHRQVIGRVGFGLHEMQRLALLVDQLRHRPGGGRHRRLVLGIGDVEAPFARLRLLVPQVALGARHAGIAFGAAAARGEPRRLGTDARHDRPDEGVGAATEARQVVLAEPGLGELDARFERPRMHALGMREVAQREFIGVVEIDAKLARRLDQEAAGARIADIEHEIDLDRAAARVLGVADQLDRREVHGLRQQARGRRGSARSLPAASA